jgi:phage tail-like protein
MSVHETEAPDPPDDDAPGEVPPEELTADEDTSEAPVPYDPTKLKARPSTSETAAAPAPAPAYDPTKLKERTERTADDEDDEDAEEDPPTPAYDPTKVKERATPKDAEKVPPPPLHDPTKLKERAEPDEAEEPEEEPESYDPTISRVTLATADTVVDVDPLLNADETEPTPDIVDLSSFSFSRQSTNVTPIATTPFRSDEFQDDGAMMRELEDATDVLEVDIADAIGFRLGSLLRAVLPGEDFPDVNYNFVVLIGAMPFGDFQSVENIHYKVDPLEYAEGGRNFSPVLLPFEKPNKRGQLVLKWGTVAWSTLYDWVNEVEIGGAFRREVFVVQLGRDGWPTRLMRFGNCWPVEWKGSDLDTGDSKWAMEQITLVYERFNMLTLRGITSIL